MRSISTDHRVSLARLMPGRYKSCRRSTSELFSKEQEQELAQCAENEVVKEQEEPEKEPLKMPEVSPPKLTPLRWRSTSMKELNGGNIEISGFAQAGGQLPQGQPVDQVSKVSTSPQPAETQAGKRPSQAQLRAQVMNFLSVEQVNSAHVVEQVSTAQVVESVDVVVNSSGLQQPIPSSTERGEKISDNPVDEGANPEKLVERVNSSERGEIVSENSANGGSGRKSVMLVGSREKVVEEIVFQPVDLDQKYREKELVRHVTAAKIQNREEALLNNPGSPALSIRKVSVGEEPAAMTIEFLRARLQAERTASKATKLRTEQLSKKVLELEGRVQAEMELRKSAENSLQDALLKLKQASPQPDQDIQQVVPSPPGSQKSAGVGELKASEKTVLRVDVEANVEVVESKMLSREDVLELRSVEKESKEGVELVNGSSRAGEEDTLSGSQDTSSSSIVNEGGLWRDRSVSPHPSGKASLKAGSSDGEGSESVLKVSQDLSSAASPERVHTSPKNKEEIRAAIEERLRSMWAKLGEEMAALAEVRGEGEHAKKDFMGWMGQLPVVLQGQQSGDLEAISNKQVDSSEGHLSAPNKQVEAHANRNIKQDGILSKATATTERRNSFKRNVSLAKNVAKLVEQYEFQETAQREWEENVEAQQSLKQQEDELPALVTRDGAVVDDCDSNSSALQAKEDIAQTSNQVEKDSHSAVGPIIRSKSMGFLPSQRGTGLSRKGSSNGRIEVLDDDPIESEGAVLDPETEVAEELPNGIYLHHSLNDADSYRRGAKDSMYRKASERVGRRDNVNSPRRPDRAPHSRERFPRTKDFHGGVDQQGWPVREVQDRASRDVYYDPVINNRGVRVDSHGNSDREFLHRSNTTQERMMDETVYRNGPRWDPQRMDPNWVQRKEERRVPGANYSRSSSEEGVPYGYRDRDHLDQDVQYRNSYRHREDGQRGMPSWQEGGDLGGTRGMSQSPYRYRTPYGVEEPHQHAQYAQPGQYSGQPGPYPEAYNGRRDMQYPPHGAHGSRPDYYPPSGSPGPSPLVNGYTQPPASRVYGGRDGGDPHDDTDVTLGASEDIPGEAGEVLKALRIAKQQIKSSTGEQAAFMTAQYTVSQEHRYGIGGQVSKTSYTVETPVGYPRVMKAVHEGWHLEGGKTSSKKRGGFVGPNGVAIDITGPNVTDLITGAGPLTVTSGESSYVEKLNVGRGIQFFFSG